MLDQLELAAKLAAKRLASNFQGVVFRSIHLRHFADFSTVNLLYCAPGSASGTRFVPPMGAKALYFALDAETAYHEVNRDFYRLAKLPKGAALIQSGKLKPSAIVLLGARIRVSHLIDLSTQRVRAKLGMSSRAEVTQPWLGKPNAPTQILGQAIYHTGQFEGIVYPSAQLTGGRCLVIFPERLSKTSVIEVSDAVTHLAATLP